MFKTNLLILIFSSQIILAQELIHTVGLHDNLMKISFKYYNTRKCWREILIRNGTMNSDKDLDPGDRVILPNPKKCFRSKLDRETQDLWKRAKYRENIELKKDFKKNKLKQVEPELRPIGVNSDSSIDNKKYFKASLSLSPFVIKRNDNEEDITYSGYLSYLKNNRELFFEYERNIFSSTDSLTRLKIKSGSQHALMTFDLNHHWGDFTYFALAGYDNEREGDVFITEDRFQVGLVGVKYYFVKNNEYLKDLSLSFIPLFEYLVENVADNPSSITNDSYHRVISKSIRQSLRLRLKASFLGNKLKVKNIIFYRPAYLLNKSKFDLSDALFEQTLKISYELNDMVDFSYKNIIKWDERAKTIHQLPSTDMTHRLTLDIYKKF